METLKVDALVIGSGPGGYVAAIRLGQLGKNTVLVEREQIGGVCLNVGCIPSKALISAAKNYEHALHGETMGISASDVKIDFARTQTWKGEVVTKLTGGVKLLLKSAGVKTVVGTAKFISAKKVEVTGGPEAVIVEAEHIVIATGSRPIEIPGFKIDQKTILDSTGGLAMKEIPKRLAVIGGGYIGLELGTAYAKLGSKVTVVEGTNQLLPGQDPELVQVVARKLKKSGIETFLESKAIGYETAKDGSLLLKIQAKDGAKTIECDKILVTVGRRPNSEDLGLDKVGVKVERGFVPTDAQMRTNVAGIYAIGDVAGQPMLAHKASKEADVVAEVIAGHKAVMDAVSIPAVIFTDPEISTVGLQQHDAEKQGRKVRIGKFPFGALGRAMAIAETDGFVKIIADDATKQVLGISVVGPSASDLISEGALAIEMGAFLDDLSLTVHPHPTLGEAFMEAAKAALGESPHLVGGGQKKA